MNKLRGIAVAILAIAILLFFLLPSMVYVVDQRELAVVLQFGNPVKEHTQPGIYFKIPFVQSVVKLPSTRQFYGGTESMPDLPTKDDKKIEVIPWAVWKINEPTVFVQRLRTMDEAEKRVRQFTRGAMRDVIPQYDLAELVRSTDRPLLTSSSQLGAEPDATAEDGTPEARRVRMNIKHGREKILAQIKAECMRRLSGSTGEEEGGGRGIELIDLGISQIEFVQTVRDKTFDRWIAERQAVSARNTNEGEKMKQEIINKAAADVERITGEGQQRANELKGEVDAEIIRSYADALTQMGEFYTFIRTLEAYEKAISSDTRLILTTDSDFLNLLKRLTPPGETQPAGAESSSSHGSE